MQNYIFGIFGENMLVSFYYYGGGGGVGGSVWLVC